MWEDRGIDPLAVTLRTEMPRCRHAGSVSTQLLTGRFVDQIQVRAPSFTSKGPLAARATVRGTGRPALTQLPARQNREKYLPRFHTLT